ncbi:helix-turn-helix domain-containing protein [Sphingomonas sp. RS2018]
MSDGYDALTDREKQTLRLILRGHDAKSIARHFDLSVHTINERLRDARRKLAVSSSREAARMLLAREGATPESVGDERIGDAPTHSHVEDPAASNTDRGRARRLAPLAIGAAVMSIAIALLAIASNPPSAVPPAPTVQAEATDAQVAAAALNWLALVDAGRWEDSWKETGSSFRKLNTAAVWAAASEKARAPLGAVRTRALVSQEDVPAPPAGYRLVKFRTSFANKADATETMTLAREDGAWRVTGIWIG